MEGRLASAAALTARTVHIKLNPAPRNFPERREVLRVLETYGEVSAFRSLKYNRAHQRPVRNAFIALFTTQSSADEALKSSPISYQLITTPDPIPLDPNPYLQPPSPTTPPEPQTRAFTMNISTTTFDHTKHLRDSNNPLAGPFRPVYHRYSYIGYSLEKIIPETIWKTGMLDWETDKGLDVGWDGSFDEVRLSSAGEAGGRSHAGMKAREKVERERRYRPQVMRGLMGLVALREQRKGA